jgi:Domain of unknown function (DUF4189)
VARLIVLSAVFGLALMIGQPVLAGYGAVAYDTDARKNGSAWDEPTQEEAKEAALRDCASDNCKVRFPVPPRMCGALATPESGRAWGGAVRKSLDAAAAAALKNCQTHAKEKCTIQQSKCTK